jgi:hypothetical protein
MQSSVKFFDFKSHNRRLLGSILNLFHASPVISLASSRISKAYFSLPFFRSFLYKGDEHKMP